MLATGIAKSKWSYLRPIGFENVYILLRMIFWYIWTLHMRDNHGSGLLVGRYVNYLSPPALWSSSLWGEKSLIPTWQRDRLDMFFALPQIVLNTIESFLMWSWTMAVITHSSSGQPWRLCQSFENGGWCPSSWGLWLSTAGYICASLLTICDNVIDLICDFKWLIILLMLCSAHFDPEMIFFFPKMLLCSHFLPCYTSCVPSQNWPAYKKFL